MGRKLLWFGSDYAQLAKPKSRGGPELRSSMERARSRSKPKARPCGGGRFLQRKEEAWEGAMPPGGTQKAVGQKPKLKVCPP